MRLSNAISIRASMCRAVGFLGNEGEDGPRRDRYSSERLVHRNAQAEAINRLSVDEMLLWHGLFNEWPPVNTTAGRTTLRLAQYLMGAKGGAS